MTTTATSDQKTVLWQAILAKHDELCRTHGGNRSQAYYGADGRSCLAISERKEADGTWTVFRIEAYDRRGEVTVTVDESVSCGAAFWRPIVEASGKDRLEAVVIGDTCYTIRPDRRDPGPGDGYDGKRFVIEWLTAEGEPTGEMTVTRNLWHRGTIPPVFREALRPNARFAIEVMNAALAAVRNDSA